MQKKINFSSQKLKNTKLDSHSTTQLLNSSTFHSNSSLDNNSTIQQINNSTSSDSFAVRVEGVSKKYCKSLKRSMLYGVKDIARNTFGLSSHSDKLRKNEFWALDDISFEVKKGETLGIIGLNGSGKTTLLKLLNGIFWPDKGKISIKGNVGALIEVGAGFHPLLTGRENIYINAAILGMTKKEVDEKFDDIVEFADIGDFLDAPVKHYSSGMFVRLGFAVAVHCEPDVLLVDEVLAVGDLGFQRKCYDRMYQIRRGDTTIILVSHNPYQIERLCDRVLLLNRGRAEELASPKDTVTTYYRLINKAQSRKPEEILTQCQDFDRQGSGEMRVTKVRILDRHKNEVNTIRILDEMTIEIHLHAFKPIMSPSLRIDFISTANTIVTSIALQSQMTGGMCFDGDCVISCRIPQVLLMSERYNLQIKLFRDVTLDLVNNAAEFTVILDDPAVIMSSNNMGLFYSVAEWNLDGITKTRVKS